MFEDSIKLLNQSIGDELAAVHQYMYFHFQCDDQGLGLFSGLFKRAAIDEMIHLEKLADRILFLKGEVELKTSEEVQKINDVNEMIIMAKQMEQDAILFYNKCAIECASKADSVTRKLFEEMVFDEEGHYAEYDAEHEKLEKYGEKYLVLQSIEQSKESSQTPHNQ